MIAKKLRMSCVGIESTPFGPESLGYARRPHPLLICLVLAVVVRALVAIPARRSGRDLLTDRGEAVRAVKTGGGDRPKAGEFASQAAAESPQSSPNAAMTRGLPAPGRMPFTGLSRDRKRGRARPLSVRDEY